MVLLELEPEVVLINGPLLPPRSWGDHRRGRCSKAGMDSAVPLGKSGERIGLRASQLSLVPRQKGF